MHIFDNAHTISALNLELSEYSSNSFYWILRMLLWSNPSVYYSGPVIMLKMNFEIFWISIVSKLSQWFIINKNLSIKSTFFNSYSFTKYSKNESFVETDSATFYATFLAV